jgi:hypothetical protein
MTSWCRVLTNDGRHLPNDANGLFEGQHKSLIASEPQATHDSTARIAKINDAFSEDTGKSFDALGGGA